MPWIVRIIVATLLVNAVSHLISEPLSSRLHVRYLRGTSEVACFIGTDMVLLGLIGFVAGMLGFWFIGFSTGGRGWPGLLSFIGMSLLGVALINPSGL